MTTTDDSEISGLPKKLYYTVNEVAPLLGVSPRWLADQCRDGEIEHVHMARKRRFTAAQVRKLLTQKTVKPTPLPAGRDRARVEALIAREQRR